jgi:hypothetical protein
VVADGGVVAGGVVVAAGGGFDAQPIAATRIQEADGEPNRFMTGMLRRQTRAVKARMSARSLVRRDVLRYDALDGDVA